MTANIFGGYDDLIVILVALVVLFGGTQLPKLARNAGEAMREFRKAHTEALDGQEGSAGAAQAGNAGGGAVSSPTPSVPGPAALATGVGSQAAAGAQEERVTLSRSELDALLAAREAQAKAEAAKADTAKA
ncbi:MAG: twin-arginine translocase TatA/TatE family subunit [Acidimicrobiales bacterium]